MRKLNVPFDVAERRRFGPRASAAGAWRGSGRRTWCLAKPGAIAAGAGTIAPPEMLAQILPRAKAAAFGDVVDGPAGFLEQDLGLR
jgi:hypothetical protein